MATTPEMYKTARRFRFVTTFDNEIETDDEALNHFMQMVRYAGWNVRVELVPNESVAVDRSRFERLLKATANWANETEYPGGSPGGVLGWAGLEPGDLDPIP